MRTLFLALLCTGLIFGPTVAWGQHDSPSQPKLSAHDEDSAHGHDSLGQQLHPIAIAPFAALLLCIALLPLVAGHWWEHNRNKGLVAGALALPVVFYLTTFGDAGQHQLQHTLAEYVSFLMLLGSLFIISGGIYVRGSLEGTAAVNTSLLALGAGIASFVGTTGASMLLIRPLLRANSRRRRKIHTVVFFIFTVSNCGGLLTPLGDPPLYLGFLAGVPFEWTFRLWPAWLVVNGSLLTLYFLADLFLSARDRAESPVVDEPGQSEGLGIDGWWNLIFLAGVVAVIYCSGNGIGTGGEAWKFPRAELGMLGLALASYCLTPRAIHQANRFNFGPIIEVAVVFAGIFATMIPALLLLNAHGKQLPLTHTWHFFWASGLLSSVLDNAPTYLTFAATACGQLGVDASQEKYLAILLQNPQAHRLLAAIACGSVFMGANTYIGNGPNFMVKAIAEEAGVKMPSFFRYLLYSGGILIPLFVLVTLLFFRE